LLDDPSVLYVGLRRPTLEWAAEIDAAAARGFSVKLASDAKLAHTGLPASRQIAFGKNGSAAETADAIAAAAGAAPAAVLCWGDRYVSLTAELADRWGLRGVTTAAAAVCTDKVAQRRALEPLGLNPRWRSGTTVDELRAAVDELGLPLVFKLAHCSGGRGMLLLDETTDLDEVVKQTTLNYNDSDAFLVEGFADGTEHSVSGIVVDGVVRVLAVTDKLIDGPGFDTWATIAPSARSAVELERISRAAEAAVRAVGIRSGGFHVDLRFTAEGPVVLEVGARLGGDTINSHLVPLASRGAVRPYDALIAAVTTGELPEPGPFPAAAAMLVLPLAGRTAGEAVERALVHADVRFAEDWSATDSSTVAVVLTVDDPATVRTAIADVRDWMR
jgi:predicted ATP-grasp superfamily ATP-dependent carboligase